jgi:hypothetical protein
MTGGGAEVGAGGGGAVDRPANIRSHSQRSSRPCIGRAIVLPTGSSSWN